ncbi:unnamed protein product [Clavelina lepadiformis]|uniref:Uncharacterized protein n=1 Tax=Clavelina lepadiformis TaxID=159417 RepID=A0ABP0G3E6_CLALP
MTQHYRNTHLLTDEARHSGTTIRWLLGQDLTENKDSPCCTVLHGNVVYAIGGRTEVKGNDSTTNQVCRLDLKKDNLEWEQIASMKVRRQVMGKAVFNGL